MASTSQCKVLFAVFMIVLAAALGIVTTPVQASTRHLQQRMSNRLSVGNPTVIRLTGPACQKNGGIQFLTKSLDKRKREMTLWVKQNEISARFLPQMNAILEDIKSNKKEWGQC